jgi:hypothetical protein
MKIYDFFVKQIRVKNAKEALILLLKLMVVFLLADGLYYSLLRLSCLLQEKSRYKAEGIIVLSLKYAVFIFIIFVFYLIGKRLKTKGHLKAAMVILAILLPLIFIFNGSLLGIYYIDGPYWGKVVDADTGVPIAGANVMGVWELEFIIPPAPHASTTYADVRETITDGEGKFFLPPARTLFLWPYSWIYLKELRVYHSGYDSHPPNMQRGWSDADKEKWKTKLLKIRPKYYYDLPVGSNYEIAFENIPKNIKIYKPTVIRLNKALTDKERRKASIFGFCFSYLCCDDLKIKRFKAAAELGRTQ